MLGAGLVLADWITGPGGMPGAVSVSLSCDDDVGVAMIDGGPCGRADEAVARGR
jgi:hypothetical protein